MIHPNILDRVQDGSVRCLVVVCIESRVYADFADGGKFVLRIGVASCIIC